MNPSIPAPAPMTQSPGISDGQASFIRGRMASHQYAVINIVRTVDHARQPWNPDPFTIPESTEFTQVHLIVRRARGYSPFVGEPVDHEWMVAISEDETLWVAGPSVLRSRYPGWPFGESPLVKVTWARWENDLVWRHHDTGKEPQS